jgi:membrane protein
MAGKLKTFIKLINDAAKLFVKNDPLRMAGATAFFTLFALPPILIILVRVFSFFFDPRTIRHEVFESLSGALGTEAVKQVGEVIRAFRQLTYTWLAAVVGFIFLLFVATTLFRVVKGSINQIWAMEKPQGKKVLITLRSRGQSLLVILSIGVLFTVGVLVETVQVLIGNFFIRFFPAASAIVNQSLSFIVTTVVTSLWFLIVFRYLADGRPGWRIAWTGALFTSVLFSIGKMVLHVLLTYNNVTNIYGASASVVLLLLFVFYSSMILYYGAAFTKVWAVYKQNDIVLRYGKVNEHMLVSE